MIFDPLQDQDLQDQLSDQDSYRFRDSHLTYFFSARLRFSASLRLDRFLRPLRCPSAVDRSLRLLRSLTAARPRRSRSGRQSPLPQMHRGARDTCCTDRSGGHQGRGSCTTACAPAERRARRRAESRRLCPCWPGARRSRRHAPGRARARAPSHRRTAASRPERDCRRAVRSRERGICR